MHLHVHGALPQLVVYAFEVVAHEVLGSVVLLLVQHRLYTTLVTKAKLT